jgi:predicted N-acetyltransferase YhbS/catechol 2,3-dioxygenase-like lactoylglutathione lyase family enzyme
MSGRWPEHLRPGALRWVRESRRYDETVAFYRDLVGLPIVGEFHESFGEDGTIFGLPDTGTQLEIVRAQPDDDVTPGRFDQIVFYLANADAVQVATAPLRTKGIAPVDDPHPYWAANGAVVFSDPDGRTVCFAPWVYGRDPEPAAAPITIDWYDGEHSAIRHLFREADDSDLQVDGYIDRGRVLVALQGTDAVGHLQLIPTETAGEIELKSLAVLAELRGSGVGRRLIERAVREATNDGYTRVVVSTGAADVGNLRFYQRCGFRFLSVERDAFTPATGYPEPILIDGVELRDRVWLDRSLPG